MTDKIRVKVDKELEELIPKYLENRRKDVEVMQIGLTTEDYESIRLIGHSMKGSGESYGLNQISEIGKAIEQAVKDQNIEDLKRQIMELKNYLDQAEVVYE